MHSPDERVESLIAAAIAGELTPLEQDELARLRLDHPWIDAEIARLGAISDRLTDADITWRTPVVSSSLRERTLGDLPSTSGEARPPREAARTRQRGWVTPLLAAACLLVGLVIGAGVPALTSTPPSGPPGTLGAVEPIELGAVEAGVDVEADLVAHTWGTEAVLDVTGLEAGETYAVVFIGADGTEFSAGEMLGSAVAIHCRLNAAVLRQDAARLEIRGDGAEVIAAAVLPSA